MPDYISDELFHFVGRSAPDDHEHNFSVEYSDEDGIFSKRCGLFVR